MEIISKLKEKLPNKLPERLNVLMNVKDKVDLKALAISLAAVIGIYVLIFGYVSLRSDAMIKSIEASIPVHIFPVDLILSDAEIEAQHSISYDKSILIEGLYQNTDDGRLPVIRDDLLTSFRAYQTPYSFENIKEKPFIALMVMDYGLSQSQSKATLEDLPANVSLMLSPYSANPRKWVKEAQNNGHEIWLDTPVQNDSQSDQGRHTLFHHAAFDEKKAALYSILNRSIGYIGLSMYTDSGALYAKDQYLQIVDDVYKRGLGFFEKNPNIKSPIEGKALAMGAPYIQADLTVFKSKGDHSFDSIKAIASKKGYAVVMVPNYPLTIRNLKSWIKNIGSKEFNIIPVSAIYDVPAHLPEVTSDVLEPHTLKASDLRQPTSDHHSDKH